MRSHVEEIILTKVEQDAHLGVKLAMVKTESGKRVPVIREVEEDGLLGDLDCSLLEEMRVLTINHVACRDGKGVLRMLKKAPLGEVHIQMGPYHMVAATVTKSVTTPNEPLGIALTQDRARKANHGIYVREIQPDSPFAQTDLEPGMRLCSMNDTKITPRTKLKQLEKVCHKSPRVTILARESKSSKKQKRRCCSRSNSSSSGISLRRSSLRDLLLADHSDDQSTHPDLSTTSRSRSQHDELSPLHNSAPTLRTSFRDVFHHVGKSLVLDANSASSLRENDGKNTPHRNKEKARRRHSLW